MPETSVKLKEGLFYCVPQSRPTNPGKRKKAVKEKRKVGRKSGVNDKKRVHCTRGA